MRPIVYITQESARKVEGEWVPQFDMTPAAEYGELRVLMPAGSSLFNVVPTVRSLKEKLKTFCDDDFLLPMGDPSIMATAAMLASHINGGKVKILKWDRGYGRYVPVQVDISGRSID